MYMMIAYAVVHIQKKKSVKTSQSVFFTSELFFLINFAFLPIKGPYQVVLWHQCMIKYSSGYTLN